MDFKTALAHVSQAGRGSNRDLQKILLGFLKGRVNRTLSISTATFSVDRDEHGSRTLVLNRASGTTVTLPAATGSGVQIKFLIGTTVSGGVTMIQANSASDVLFGNCVVSDDGSSVSIFETAADSDSLILSGTTTGGVKGDVYEFTDVAAGEWAFEGVSRSVGAAATPFGSLV